MSKKIKLKIINNGHSITFFGLNSFNSKHNSKGIYAKNILSVINSNIRDSNNEITIKIIK